MTYEYVGIFASDPFDESTIRTFKGLIKATTRRHAFERAEIALQNEPTVNMKHLINWHVREANHDA